MTDEGMADPQEPPEPMEGIQVRKAVPLKTSKPHVVVKLQVPVDEEHPVVVQLLILGYELEQCIQAAELYPDDATAAQEYLLDMGEKGDLFNDVPLKSHTLHTDTEMPLEMPAVEQQGSSDFTSYNERYVKVCFNYLVNQKY